MDQASTSFDEPVKAWKAALIKQHTTVAVCHGIDERLYEEHISRHLYF